MEPLKESIDNELLHDDRNGDVCLLLSFAQFVSRSHLYLLHLETLSKNLAPVRLLAGLGADRKLIDLR